MAWRVADSLSLRSFLDLELTEAAPDHSTLSRTRRRIDVETHEAVFTWVLERLSAAGLVRGRVWLFFVDGPRGLTRAARQELLDRSKAGRVWRRRRIADRRCYPISV